MAKTKAKYIEDYFGTLTLGDIVYAVRRAYGADVYPIISIDDSIDDHALAVARILAEIGFEQTESEDATLAELFSRAVAWVNANMDEQIGSKGTRTARCLKEQRNG